jgi:uncharacterized phage protein (TIGR02218 family)
VKTISAAMATHISGTVLTLATCWKVTRTDGVVFGFTDYSEDISFESVLYRASTGYESSAVQSSSDMAIDNLEISGALNSAAIVESDVFAGVWDHAEVEWFRVNYESLGDGKISVRNGRLGEIRVAGIGFFAELRGLMWGLQQTVGEVYTPSCQADLFDARCTLNADDFDVTGTVTHVTDQANFRDTSRTEVDDYFGGGRIYWTGGAASPGGLNSGKSMEIKTNTQATGLFTLQMPMIFPIQVGDTYVMWPGCRKRFAEDCVTKFSNGVNFRGFPHVPGLDAIFKRP